MLFGFHDLLQHKKETVTFKETLEIKGQSKMMGKSIFHLSRLARLLDVSQIKLIALCLAYIIGREYMPALLLQHFTCFKTPQEMLRVAIIFNIFLFFVFILFYCHAITVVPIPPPISLPHPTRPHLPHSTLSPLLSLSTDPSHMSLMTLHPLFCIFYMRTQPKSKKYRTSNLKGHLIPFFHYLGKKSKHQRN